MKVGIYHPGEGERCFSALNKAKPKLLVPAACFVDSHQSVYFPGQYAPKTYLDSTWML